MSEETGIVENIKGKWAWVKTERKGTCSSCGHRSHCQMIDGGTRVLVKARNAAGAKEGDEVELFISTKTKMKCVFMVYMIPVLGLMVGAFSSPGLSSLTGMNPTAGMALFSIAGLVIAFLLMRQYSKHMELKGALTPLVRRVMKSSGAR